MLLETIFRSVSGTLLNAGTVLVGGVVGLLLGARLPARVREKSSSSPSVW